MEMLDLPNESDIGYGQIFSVIARRSIWIVGSLSVATLVTVYNYLQKEPTYVSSMQLLIEPNYKEQERAARTGIDGSTFTQSGPFEIDYATQIRVMQGSELLERAVSDLQQTYPEITVEEIQEKLSVLRSTVTETSTATDETETNIIQVDYTSNDPELSKQVVEALKQVYLNYNLEQQEFRLQQGLAFINEQLPLAQESLSATERSLRQFRENQNVIDPEQRAADLATTLDEIKQERQLVRADFEDLAARYEELSRQLSPSPQGARVSTRLSESTRYQSLLDAYQQTELALAEQRGQFTNDSAYVRRLERQLEGQKELLQEEAKRITGNSAIPEEQLLQEGQFGETDLAVFRELGELEASIQGLAGRDASLANAERRIIEELSTYPTLIKQYNQLQPEIEIQQETLQGLLRARQEVSIDIAKGGLNWQVIESPQIGRKTGPTLVTDLILGGIAGLFLGVALAFAREAVDGKIRNIGQLEKQSPVPILGSVPDLKRDNSQTNFALKLLATSNNRYQEVARALAWPQFKGALSSIYRNLQTIQTQIESKSIAITSALPGEGKSTTALGLALTAARAGQNVLLIDADFTSPSIHELLNIQSEQGLSSFLLGKDASPLIQEVEFEGFIVDTLLIGKVSDIESASINWAAFQNIVNEFKGEYDLILLDTSNIASNGETLDIVSFCDASILVSRLNKVTQEDINEALSLLFGLNLVGIIASADPSPNPNANFINNRNHHKSTNSYKVLQKNSMS